MSGLTPDAWAGYRKSLDEDGYLVVKEVVSSDRLAAFDEMVADEFARINRDSVLFDGGGFYSGHLNCLPGTGARFAYDDIVDAGVVDFIRTVNPAWADRPRLMMNYNLPDSHAQHYHMDGVYLADFLICNIAVVDTDLSNGALDVLPATNRRFYRFWQYAVQRKFRSTTRVPLSRGDIVIRRSTLWHRGMPNRSAKARPMLAFTFGDTPTANPDPFAGSTEAMEFYPNWYQPTAIGRIRERITVAAPITFSSYRFVRSLFSDKGYSS